MRPPVICIVGTDKKAKTRLMELLITELKKKGLGVGALKYHKHGDFDMDIEGKDTWIYANAGADTVAITSSLKFALIKYENVPTDIDEICEKYFYGSDIILADGFTLSDKPRIIVVEKKEDAGIFERGCKVISVVDGATKDITSILKNVLDFLELPAPD